jgi:4-hydroxy-tetrahydrodipicolinate reductase
VGTVAAQRITVSVLRRGQPLLRFRANWHCTTALDPAWDLRATGRHVSVEGGRTARRRPEVPRAPRPDGREVPLHTANRAENAVPFVCAAAPGIRYTADLPQIVADLG